MPSYQKLKSARGFTLVELSIVLVIIGLIIGGVLTGQQIIQNARVTNAISSIQAFQAQFQTYVQNYGALPGDDNNAKTHFANITISGNGNGDGAIGTQGTAVTDSPFDTKDTTSPTGEARLVWEHMRAASLVKNQQNGKSTAVQPPNPFNGLYGFQNGAFAGVFSTTVLCLSNVPAAAAQTIDSRLDDGETQSGAIQASTAGANSATSKDYSSSSAYTLCVRM